MTEYQKAVAEHMKDAPQALREYVCGCLTNYSWWTEGYAPIDRCNFSWDKSEEGLEFWMAIDKKHWQKAIDTDFWQSYTKQLKPESMTEYQLAVAEHMKDAPEQLREYVCRRLVESNEWEERRNPILWCGFDRYQSEEGNCFWYYVSAKKWLEAMDTDYWKYFRKYPKEITKYQVAVAEHMADAPQVLKEYVCVRLQENSYWILGINPIAYRDFDWRESKEGFVFWECVYRKEWQDAMNTEFWKSHTQQPKPDHYKHFSCESFISMATDFRQNRNNEETKTMTDYQNKIREQYVRLLDKQLAKNKDYGNSVFNDIEVFGETISAETSCKARIADKLKRLSSASFQVDESHDDTIDDLIGYLVAYRIIRNNKRHTKIEL